MKNFYVTIPLLVLLVLGIGFFSSSETAYLSLPKIKMRALLAEKRKGARTAARLKANMDRLLTTVLIGTNFFNSLASALATAFAIEVLGPKGRVIAPFVASFFISTFGQIIPKTAASLHTGTFVCYEAMPLLFLEKLLFPIVWLFEKLSHVAVSIVEKIIKPSESVVTEEELKTLIEVGEKEGTIEKSESRLLNKLIMFNDLSVSDLMKHRNTVGMISTEASYDEVTAQFIKSGFSTLTVYKDSPENVVGVINYRQLLLGDDFADAIDASTGVGYAQIIMRHVMFVPGTLSIQEMLSKFRQSKHKFAVVLNEQGVTIGVITIEDIMKYVFGRMTDENTYDNIPAEDKIQLISFNTFMVPGELKIEEVNEILGLQLESECFNTIGGWVLERIGHLPHVGEVISYEKTLFFVEEVEQHRITSIKIKK